MRTPQEVPDCTIYQHRMGLHRVVACILDPNHGCIRRIVVEVVQLTGQAVRVLHTPKNQCGNLHPERCGGGSFRYIGKESGSEVWHFCMRCIRDGRRHLNRIRAVVIVPGRIRRNSTVTVALVLRCLNLRRAIADLTEKYGWGRRIENDQAFNTALIRRNSTVTVALVLRCLNLRRAIADLTEKYGWVRRIENDQAFNTARIGRSKYPSNVATPVIAHQDAPLTAEMTKQGMYIAQRSRHSIRLDCFRSIR